MSGVRTISMLIYSSVSVISFSFRIKLGIKMPGGLLPLLQVEGKERKRKCDFKPFLFFSRLGRDLTWQFMKENWETYQSKFQGSFLLSRVIEVGYNQCTHNIIECIGGIVILQTCCL